MIVTKLLVDSRAASKMLSISERTLHTLTRTGRIPAIRIGRSVRYSVADLERWIEQKKGGQP